MIARVTGGVFLVAYLAAMLGGGVLALSARDLLERGRAPAPGCLEARWAVEGCDTDTDCRAWDAWAHAGVRPAILAD